MVEHATGANMWAEWARVEVAHVRGEPYTLPSLHQDHAGLIVSLARQEWPDTAAYSEAEIVWRLHKRHHVGFIIASPEYARVQTLISEYAPRIAMDFAASAPPMEGARQ